MHATPRGCASWRVFCCVARHGPRRCRAHSQASKHGRRRERCATRGATDGVAAHTERSRAGSARHVLCSHGARHGTRRAPWEALQFHGSSALLARPGRARARGGGGDQVGGDQVGGDQVQTVNLAVVNVLHPVLSPALPGSDSGAFFFRGRESDLWRNRDSSNEDLILDYDTNGGHPSST